jgi:hypothetical protein
VVGNIEHPADLMRLVTLIGQSWLIVLLLRVVWLMVTEPHRRRYQSILSRLAFIGFVGESMQTRVEHLGQPFQARTVIAFVLTALGVWGLSSLFRWSAPTPRGRLRRAAWHGRGRTDERPRRRVAGDASEPPATP